MLREVTTAIEGPDDAPEQCHDEMGIDGRGRIMLGSEWAEWTRSPVSVGGANTQSTHVAIGGDLEAHCERARATGATIAAEPEDRFYGDRTDRAVDHESHVWTFATHVREVTRAETETAIGQAIHARDWA